MIISISPCESELTIVGLKTEPIFFVIPNELKNSKFLKIYFWFFQHDKFLGYDIATQRMLVNKFHGFLSFINHPSYKNGCLGLDGELIDTILELYDQYLVAKKKSIGFRASIQRGLLTPINFFQAQSNYRSLPLWSHQIDGIKKNANLKGVFPESNPKKSLAEIAEIYLTKEEAIKFESEELKCWFIQSWNLLQQIRNSLLKLDYVQLLISEHNKLSESELNSDEYQRFFKFTSYSNLCKKYQEKASLLVEAILSSKDEFLINCLFHSLPECLFDSSSCQDTFLVRNSDVSYQIKLREHLRNKSHIYPERKRVEENGAVKKITFKWHSYFSINFVLNISDTELILVMFLLGYHQLPARSIGKLTLQDFKYNSDNKSLWVEGSKNRDGTNCADSTRIVGTDEFQMESIEYKILNDFVGFSSDKPTNEPLFESLREVLGNQYIKHEVFQLESQFKWNPFFSKGGVGKSAQRFSNTITKLFKIQLLKRRANCSRTSLTKKGVQALNIEIAEAIGQFKNNKLTVKDFKNISFTSVTVNSFRLSAIAHNRKYAIKFGKSDSLFSNPHMAPESAAKYAHSPEVEHDSYFLKMQSPILIDSERKFGEQVSGKQFQDAKKIWKTMKRPAEQLFNEMNDSSVVSNPELFLKQQLGIDTLSDNYDSFSDIKFVFDKAFNEEFIDWQGIGGITLGLKKNQQIYIIEHPIVATFMLQQIKQIDEHLLELGSFKQQSYKEELDDDLTKYIALRAFLALKLEGFRDSTVKTAREYLDSPDLPVLPPL